MRILSLTATFIALFCLATTAEAQKRPEHLVLGVGGFDVIDGEDPSAQFSAEYRSRYLVASLRPVVGVSLNTDGGMYAYGGFNYDLDLFGGIMLTPGLTAGKWEKRDSKDLGHNLEFRSSLELSYRMKDNSRLGVMVDHISNASLGDKNPGAESLMLNYAHPISILGPN